MKQSIKTSHDPSVATSYLQQFIDKLSLNPVEVQALLIQANISAEFIKHPYQRIPLLRVTRFLSLAMQEAQARDLGIRVGQAAHPGYWGQQATLMMSSSTLLEAFQGMLIYEDIINSGVSSQLIFNGDWVEYRVDFPVIEDCELARPLVERDFIAIFHIAGFLINKPMLECVKIKAISFRNKKPSDLEDNSIYRQISGIEPEFSAPFNKVIFHKSIFNEKIATANPELLPHLQRQFDQVRIAELASEHLHNDVSSHIRNSLSTGSISLEDCATKMGISVSTLKRRLKKEDTSFREIAETIRQQAAKDWLLDKSLGLTEISLLLGYSDASAFNNAFKKWTGLSPLKYRKQN